MILKLNLSREKQLSLNHLNILFVLYSNFSFSCKKMSDTSTKMSVYQNFEFYLRELPKFYVIHVSIMTTSSE